MIKKWKKYLGGQQRTVLMWCSRGLIMKEIADKLGISLRTVENHCAAICRRLRAVNIKHAIYIAMRLRLI